MFNTNYVAYYTYSETGNSSVRLDISLTNTTSAAYPTSYQLLLGGENPINIYAKNDGGELPLTLNQLSATSTVIDISFPVSTVGKNAVTNFSIFYTGTPAHKTDHAWEISLPKLAKESVINNYTLHLYLPESFGKSIYTSEPAKFVDNHLVFTKNQLTDRNLNVSVGDFTTYDFSNSYTLTNSSLLPQTQTITLPSDSTTQKVFFDQISPQPTKISDNWTATYHLAPRQTLKINTTGQIRSSVPLALTPATYRSYPVDPPQTIWHKPIQILPFISLPSSVEINNPNGQALPGIQLSLASSELKLAPPTTFTIPSIPPYAKIHIPLHITTNFFPEIKSQQLTLAIDSQSKTYNINANSFFAWYAICIFIISTSLLALANLASRAWSLYLQKRHR